MSILQQIKEIDPSDKAALFRRLLYQKDLGYLRDKNGDKKIIGFNVQLDQQEELSGFTIIAIQKHTILAYKSDLGEDEKLILFPSLDKLSDPSFEMDNLEVTREIYSDDSFNGQVVSKGTLSEVTQDLLPPYKKVEVSDDFGESLTNSLLEASKSEDEKQAQKPSQKIKPDDLDDEEVPAGDGMPNGDDIDGVPPDFDESVPPDFDDSPLPPDVENDDEMDDDSPADEIDDDLPDDDLDEEDPRAKELNQMSGKFTKMSDLTYYVVTHYGVNADMANNVATAAIGSVDTPATQIDVAILLYIKLFHAGKI